MEIKVGDKYKYNSDYHRWWMIILEVTDKEVRYGYNDRSTTATLNKDAFTEDIESGEIIRVSKLYELLNY